MLSKWVEACYNGFARGEGEIMRRIQCHECGKRYNYDEDAFCPNCGAFNQPQRASRIGADGSVVWLDGLIEQTHAGSFIHRELHAEDQERRRTGLEKGVQRIQRRPAAAPANPHVPHTAQRRQSRSQPSQNPLGIIVWIIFAIIAINILGSFLTIFL